MTTITERVAKGAQFLDERDPEWWREIDLDSLDLGSGGRCILGQRCPLEGPGPYSRQAEALSGLTWEGDDGGDALHDWAARHGFDTDGQVQYWDLTAEWRKVIEARRSA